MTVKVLALIRSCAECPNKSYYSGGRSECTKAGALLPMATRTGPTPPPIPDWCPLADYPAAAMQRERDRAREPEQL